MATLEIESRGKVEVYYEEEGAGEPLVMVGGLTATVEVWGKLRPLLAAQASASSCRTTGGRAERRRIMKMATARPRAWRKTSWGWSMAWVWILFTSWAAPTAAPSRCRSPSNTPKDSKPHRRVLSFRRGR